MKMKTVVYTFIASFVVGFSAQAEDGNCKGYFQPNAKKGAEKYVLTDYVPEDVLEKEGDLIDEIHEKQPPYDCVPTLQEIIRIGGIRVWNENIATVMKLQIHPEEGENVIALLSDAELTPNPKKLKIRFSSAIEKNGSYAFLVTVSKK